MRLGAQEALAKERKGEEKRKKRKEERKKRKKFKGARIKSYFQG